MDVWTECYRRDISIHALREEGDTKLMYELRWDFVFLSTPSARRATLNAIFTRLATNTFLSTPSARRATVVDAAGICTFLFLSTPSARRATR